MKLIGITGGVGAGKTEILSFIKQHYNCEIHLADEVAKKIQEPGEVCYAKVVSLLGNEVLAPDGRIDRGKMATKIFLNTDLLRKINDIVHPAVRTYLEQAVMKARQEGNVELFFIEAALLIESGYRDFVDEMWYIYADDSVRRERLKKSRGYTPEKIAKIMESQLSDEAFREGSDFVIDNSGDFGKACMQIKKRLEAYTWEE